MRGKGVLAKTPMECTHHQRNEGDELLQRLRHGGGMALRSRVYLRIKPVKHPFPFVLSRARSGIPFLSCGDRRDLAPTTRTMFDSPSSIPDKIITPSRHSLTFRSTAAAGSQSAGYATPVDCQTLRVQKAGPYTYVAK